MSLWRFGGIVLIVLAAVFAGGEAFGQDEEAEGSFLWGLESELNGFYEMRAGYRTRKDRYEKDMSIMETRLQLDWTAYNDWADFKVKGDIFGDLVDEQADFDLREANMFFSPLEFMDVKVGRQVAQERMEAMAKMGAG